MCIKNLIVLFLTSRLHKNDIILNQPAIARGLYWLNSLEVLSNVLPFATRL